MLFSVADWNNNAYLLHLLSGYDTALIKKAALAGFDGTDTSAPFFLSVREHGCQDPATGFIPPFLISDIRLPIAAKFDHFIRVGKFAPRGVF